VSYVAVLFNFRMSKAPALNSSL